MAEDRRRHDPFAPAPARTPPPSAAAVAAAVDAHTTTTSPAADLESTRKAVLIQMAEEDGLDSSGTKAELIARIRWHRQSGG